MLKLDLKNLQTLRGSLRKKIIHVKHHKQYPDFSLREPKYFIALPKLQDITKTDIKYPLLEPFVFAHVKWNAQEKRIIYSISEPVLNEKEKDLFSQIQKHLVELIDVSVSALQGNDKALDYMESQMEKVLDDLGLTVETGSYMKIMYFIYRNFIGLNDIEPLMHDPYIEDIGCTGLNNNIYIVHRKFGNIITNLKFTDQEYFTNFVIKLSERCGRYISYADPLLDGTLPDGSRVQASLAKDVTTKGPTFTIRKFRQHPFSAIDIMKMGTGSSLMMAYLWFLIEHYTSALICGGVSTGKTTMLNTLSMFIKQEDKIVSIEDVREINIPHENWIPSTSRTGFGIPQERGKRYGEIELFDLLKESFRMTPDYVIVGEVRGKETYVMFQGIASGNASLGTMHAGSVEDVIKRLETPPIELSSSLIEALDVIIVMSQAREKGKSSRRIKEIVEIESVNDETGNAHYTKTFSWIPSEDYFKENLAQSLILRKISFETGLDYHSIVEDIKNREKVLNWLLRFNVTDFTEVNSIFNLYRKDKETVLSWIEQGVSPFKEKSKKHGKKFLESATGLKTVKVLD